MEKEYIVECKTKEQTDIVFAKLYPGLGARLAYYKYVKSSEDYPARRIDNNLSCWEESYPVYTFEEWKRMIDVKLVTDLRKDEAIICQNLEEAKAIRQLMHDAGLKTGNGNDWIDRKYNDELCFFPTDGQKESGPIDYLIRFCKSREYKWFHASDFLQTNIITNPKIETMKSVTQEQLKEIHRIACQSWKPRIEEYAKRNVFGDINLTDKEVQEMFEAATSSQKLVLEKIFGKNENLLRDMPNREFAQSQYSKAYFYREDDVLFGFSINNGCLTTVSSNAIDKVGNWANVPATYLGKSIQL